MQAEPSTLVPVLPQGCTNFKLRQLMRRVAAHYDAEMARCGLKTTQYSLLSHVLKLGPIRPGDLAAAMKMDASTLTRNLRPLVDAGWVTLEAGTDADFIVLDMAATPAMALRAEVVNSLTDELFLLQTMGDDRAIVETYVAGKPAKSALAAA